MSRTSAHGRASAAGRYDASDIDVLEGLEPVRRNPGMYVGGRDETAVHHLAAEVIDNAMDEVVAGFATRVEVTLRDDGSLEVRDDGRGIPVDPHPRFPSSSALEVVMTTLHAGGKFRREGERAYVTAGGLHGVGVSVVNALSEWLDVEVARDRVRHGMRFRRGDPVSGLEDRGPIHNRKGTTVRFRPDRGVFGAEVGFRASRLFAMARSKAYLFRKVRVIWRCDPGARPQDDDTPTSEEFQFPDGLRDYLLSELADIATLCEEPFADRTAFADAGTGEVEWAIAWATDRDPFLSSYANAIATPLGGTHVAGLRDALRKGIRAHGERVGKKRAAQISSEDIFSCACAMISVFLSDPEFAGQTKERLISERVQKNVEATIRDRFDSWLGNNPATADRILEHLIAVAERRIRLRQEKETLRKSAVRKLRLPGKLADCADPNRDGTEIFLVEGDSAGGSAKQARDRRTQAILPLRGKILNVAAAGADKVRANQELQDLMQALGARAGASFRVDDLRYERIIILTDADVDGAHIASLLMTFFYTQTPELVASGRLYLATPPLYRIAQGDRARYARDEAHKDELLRTEFANGPGKPTITRFKGLGEMMPAQLRETAMHPDTRRLVRIEVPEDARDETSDMVRRLMGRKADARYRYLKDNARFAPSIDA